MVVTLTFPSTIVLGRYHYFEKGGHIFRGRGERNGGPSDEKG